MKPGAARVWLFSATLTVLAAAVLALTMAVLPADEPAFALPWWVVALGFFGAEGFVVHFQFRREAHSFSLSEVALVTGLYCLTPAECMLAMLAGVTVALVVRRRQAPIKLVFNLAQMSLGLAVGLVVFHVVADGGVIGPPEWIGTFGATIASGIVGTFAVATVISLAEGRPEYGKLAAVLALSTTITATNTSLAILGVTIVTQVPESMWLMVIPLATVFAAYRAYIAEREKHETVQFLYESSRILHRTPEMEAAIVALLDHARRMFRAEIAEIVLLDGGAASTVLRTTVGPGESRAILVPGGLDPVGEQALAQDRPIRVLDPAAVATALAARQDGVAIANLMVSPVRSETRPVGVMIIANRVGDVSMFSADDLILLETLAGQAGVALENGQLERSIHSLTELRDELHHQANHDSLTGLVNRRYFAAHVQGALDAAREDGQIPVVLFLDLDDFKLVNDSLGHAAGDALLRRTADRIRVCAGDLGVAARIGGDEFAVMLLDFPDLHRAEALAASLLEALQVPVMLDGHEMTIAVSVGIACSGGSVATADALLRNADIAMYTAKARGKARAELFAPSMRDAVVERQSLSADLRQATNRGELTLFYQPIVDIRSGAVTGFEALVRWNHPVHGLLAPGRFIGLAEETGAIAAIAEWTIREACLHLTTLGSAARGADWFVSVNISGHNLADARLVDVVRGALLATGLPPQQLVLEVTESVLVRDSVTAAARLGELRALGVRVAIDDFGTGYSSLGYLNNLPVDALKIARDFVDTIETDDRVAALATTIIALAGALDLDVIAEGIERPGQAERLSALGCVLAQGFLYARPLASDDLGAWLERGTASERRAA